MSLRKYLLISLLLIIASVGGITLWSSYQASRHEVQELFDAQLSRSARLLLSMAVADIREGHIRELQDLLLENQLRIESQQDYDQQETDDGDDDAADQGHYYETKLAFQVWDRHGNMVLRSVNAPLVPLADHDQGYGDKHIDGTDWRIFSLWSHDRQYLVMAAERYEVRMELVHAIAVRLILPFLLMLPILAWLLWMAVGRGLAPLKRVAAEVQNRGEHYLDSIDERHAPAEVQPLVHSLNRLMADLRDSLEKERRFTSDAAHELRTPLAALKTHAQLARSAPGKKERDHALSRLVLGVDRASHVVDQLLALARFEPGAASAHVHMQALDLHRLVVEEVSSLVNMASNRHIELSVDDPGERVVTGDPVALSMLVRNLIDNGIRYTPEGGSVAVSFHSGDGDAICMRVTDTGPGIPEAERDKIFQRFYRGEGVEQPGCGIGLSIVQRIVEMHDGHIRLDRASPQGGLRVDVCLARS